MKLPIDTVLPDLITALRHARRAVLQAPPGAGKTTRVPLALLQSGMINGRILMLEPRRVAARAAADRMAETTQTKIGGLIGYRMRGDTRVSSKTQIEVVTEGVLTRMIQHDPELSGIGAIIFDEFHERSLHADLGLALCLDIAGSLREDLHLIVMSATLDASPVAALMGECPIITSEGRHFDVEIRHLPRPAPKAERFETGMAALITEAARTTKGGILAFLPGVGEIMRTAALLKDRLPKDHHVLPLHGAMNLAAQRAAIVPLEQGRKIVLSTAIAETSLTIPDIRVVVDGGKARRARLDPGSGMSRLVTEPVSRAEAAQRAGRAGRTAPGVAYRYWSAGAEGALPAYPPTEIETADLTPLALDLAAWGCGPQDLAFLTQPPAPAWAEARKLLRALEALDEKGHITPHGKAMSDWPLHPRLAHMMLRSGKAAAPLTALLSDRDPLETRASDATLRLSAIADPKAFRHRTGIAANDPAIARIRKEAERLAAMTKDVATDTPPGLWAAFAYPDRIGKRRPGDAPRYVLSGGKGAALDAEDHLAGAPYLVALDLDGNPREARIRLALPLSEADIRANFANQIVQSTTCQWSRRHQRVEAQITEALGAMPLCTERWQNVPDDAIANAALDGFRDIGLRFSPKAARFAARVGLARHENPDLPDMTESALTERLQDWLLPFLPALRTAGEIRSFDILPALEALLTWEDRQGLDDAVPEHFVTPLGRKVPIDYSTPDPEIAVPLQEMFGLSRHPIVAGRPLRVTLLSPARRPLQTTMDLPGFWETSYMDVRKDMRGRYPKHPWPENPGEAMPTARAKPRR